MQLRGMQTDTLIVSDIHLGLPASRPSELLKFFESWSCKRIILLGDVFNDLHFRHLCRDAHKLMDYWRFLMRRGTTELVWIMGNHDRHLASALKERLDIKGHETFRWNSNAKRYLALHGDQFDPSISHFQALPVLLSDLNSWAQRRCGLGQGFAKTFDIIHERFGSLSIRMPLAAAKFAGELDCDAVVCGHTHRCKRKAISNEHGTIEYLNAGAWVGRPGHFVTVNDGVAALLAHP